MLCILGAFMKTRCLIIRTIALQWSIALLSYKKVQNSATECNTVQYNTLQYSVAKYGTVQYSAVMCGVACG